MAKSLLVDSTCQAMRRESGECREDRKCYEKTRAKKQNVKEREEEGGRGEEEERGEEREGREREKKCQGRDWDVYDLRFHLFCCCCLFVCLIR